MKKIIKIAPILGHTLATGDFNGNGYDDLAVGVPYEDIGNYTFEVILERSRVHQAVNR